MNRQLFVRIIRLVAAVPLATYGVPVTLTAALPVLTARPAVAPPHETDAPPEAATASRLLSVPLPDGAMRLRAPGPIAALNKPLSDVAKSQSCRYDTATTESLFWTGPTHTPQRGKMIQDALIATLKKAGYRYEEVGEKDSDEGHLTFFILVRGKAPAKQATLGLWMARKEILLMAWGTYRPDKAAASPKPAKPQTPPAPKKSVGDPSLADQRNATDQKKLDAALVTAMEEGTAARVRELLTQGANPNAKDDSGSPCVLIAVSRGELAERLEKLTALLEAGGDPNKGSGDFLPLHTASLIARLDVMELLLDKGADINGQTGAGATPLHSAAIGQKVESAKLLLKRGADAQKRDNNNRTARELAEALKATEVAAALREAETASE